MHKRGNPEKSPLKTKDNPELVDELHARNASLRTAP
jgi:hypothetical protein